MSSHAFMPPALPQAAPPNPNAAPGKRPAAFRSNRLGDSPDQSQSFSATLNRISERNCCRNPDANAAKKPAKISSGTDTEPVKSQKMCNTKACTLPEIEDNAAPVSADSGKESRPLHPWLAFGLMPYPFLSDSGAADDSFTPEPSSDLTPRPGLGMLTDLIDYLQSQGQKVHSALMGIGPFEQLQANISPEAFNRFFVEHLAAWAIRHQDSGALMDKPLLDGAINGSSVSSGINLNAALNALIHMQGISVTAWDLNPDSGYAGGLKMAGALEAAHLQASLVSNAPSPQTIAAISENTKSARVGPEGSLPFWASGDSNSETLADERTRQLGAHFQTLKNAPAPKAVSEPAVNPNSTLAGGSARTPEEVFGIKNAISKSEILPIQALGSKISHIDGESRDSSLLFSQDQLPQHLARLEDTAQRSEAAQRSLMSQTLNQIVQKAVLFSNNGQHEVQIDLKPDFLGHIRMQIITESHQVAVRIVAELPFVKDMLESNLNQLKAELQAQGLKVDELEVSVAHDSGADDDKHRKASEVIRAQALKTSRLSVDAAAEEQTDARIGRSDASVETAIDYFA